jgi:hypothetical protein
VALVLPAGALAQTSTFSGGLDGWSLWNGPSNGGSGSYSLITDGSAGAPSPAALLAGDQDSVARRFGLTKTFSVPSSTHVEVLLDYRSTTQGGAQINRIGLIVESAAGGQLQSSQFFLGADTVTWQSYDGPTVAHGGSATVKVIVYLEDAAQGADRSILWADNITIRFSGTPPAPDGGTPPPDGGTEPPPPDGGTEPPPEGGTPAPDGGVDPDPGPGPGPVPNPDPNDPGADPPAGGNQGASLDGSGNGFDVEDGTQEDLKGCGMGNAGILATLMALATLYGSRQRRRR